MKNVSPNKACSKEERNIAYRVAYAHELSELSKCQRINYRATSSTTSVLSHYPTTIYIQQYVHATVIF